MQASAVDLLLSRSGYAGADMLRKLAAGADAGDAESGDGGSLLSKFVQKYPEVARAWVGAPSSDVGGLDAARLDELIQPNTSVEQLAKELRGSRLDIVRILNNALFQAVQLSAPDGERVSEQALRHLDADLLHIAQRKLREQT